jgi:hypothetical protein
VVFTERLWSPPAATATGLRAPVTWTGVVRLEVVPSPIWPYRL